MAQKFYFDDEFDFDDKYTSSESQPSINKIQKPKQQTKPKAKTTVEKTQSPKTKKVGKKSAKQSKNQKVQNQQKKHKKLFIFLSICIALFVALVLYCVVVSMQKGPIYANRGEGLKAKISSSQLDQAVSQAKSNYNNIEMIDYEIACKQVKIDILFKNGTTVSSAKKTGEQCAHLLDDIVGLSKKEGSSYSDLFGVIDGKNQYEVNLYMTSSSKDFPIYGTKTCRSDQFGFTLASVKDSTSAKKAQDTLKK